MAQESRVCVIDKQVWLGNEIRFFKEDDDFFFHAKDICDALGINNSRDLISKIKKKFGEATVAKNYARNSRNEKREAAFVEESIVYCAIIGRSNKPAAVEFTRWMGKVIKSVRRTGRYEIESERKKIDIESRKVDLELIKLSQQMFSDDARMMSFVQEKMASLMVSDQKLITNGAESLKTVSELMETRYNTKTILKNRIKCGRLVAKKYRLKYGEPKTTKTLCNGKICDIKIYESQYFEEILAWIAERLN